MILTSLIVQNLSHFHVSRKGRERERECVCVLISVGFKTASVSISLTILAQCNVQSQHKSQLNAICSYSNII
jgi:hypothetical protein